MRGAVLLAAVALAGCGRAAAEGPGELAVQRADLVPGTITLIVANDTDEPATLCQVAVDDGFVPYDGPPTTIAAHATGRIAVPYPWIAGEGYSVKVLTDDGEALEYDVEA